MKKGPRKQKRIDPEHRNLFIFRSLIRTLRNQKPSATPAGELLVKVGRFFLGAPYKANTLETESRERLVINLQEFDCLTFVETALAVTWLLLTGKRSFGAFRDLLRQIRYRGGHMKGYASRLHYFSDWIYDNEKKGFVRNVTAQIGSKAYTHTKPLAFMTSHPELYPALSDATTFQRMKSIERAISRRSLSLVPKGKLARFENRINNGDLIALTTETEGLDIQHVGIGVKIKGRIHLLHASSREKRVTLSRETLYRYLARRTTLTGVMVARLHRKRYRATGTRY